MFSDRSFRPEVGRVYQKLYLDHVLQADEGCDLDVLIRRPFTAVAPV